MQPQYADQYDYLEGHHWYFRARRVVLRELISQIEWPGAPRILEVGCGPGHNLVEIYPKDARLDAVEPDAANAKRATERSSVAVHCAEVEQLPASIADASYDAVALFDVLEHIRDDRGALAILRHKIKPGGLIIIGVPAFAWMWGQQDIVNQHFRRYTMRELRETVSGTGFAPERCTYYNTVLFPPIAAVRLFDRLRHKKVDESGDFGEAGSASSPILYRAFAMERYLLRFMNFPFGVSAFIAARKKGYADGHAQEISKSREVKAVV